MYIFLMVLHIVLVVVNTILAVMNFKMRNFLIGTLWTITVPLWMINVVIDIIKLSC